MLIFMSPLNAEIFKMPIHSCKFAQFIPVQIMENTLTVRLLSVQFYWLCEILMCQFRIKKMSVFEIENSVFGIAMYGF